MNGKILYLGTGKIPAASWGNPQSLVPKLLTKKLTWKYVKSDIIFKVYNIRDVYLWKTFSSKPNSSAKYDNNTKMAVLSAKRAGMKIIDITKKCGIKSRQIIYEWEKKVENGKKLLEHSGRT